MTAGISRRIEEPGPTNSPDELASACAKLRSVLRSAEDLEFESAQFGSLADAYMRLKARDMEAEGLYLCQVCGLWYSPGGRWLGTESDDAGQAVVVCDACP